MSLTTTETMTDLQRRLQPLVAPAPGQATQQVRFRGAGVPSAAASPSPSPSPAAPSPNPATTLGSSPHAAHATLTRRFSFVWPFISKESATSCSGPYLRSRCTQLLRQFPAFLSSRHSEASKRHGAECVRDTISKVLTQLKRVWLVLAVYAALAVLLGLTAAVGYALWFAVKPLGLWFLVACVGATGYIAVVSFSSRDPCREGVAGGAEGRARLLAQDSRANLH